MSAGVPLYPTVRSLSPLALLWACSQPDLEAPLVASGRPAVVPGVVLLAEIGESVTVDGSLAGPQWVDLDEGGDERYGFRYRVLDGDGELLYERSTVGPALVESFLGYWSEISGIDILQSLPTLGRFPLTVPLLPDAARLELEVRGDDGAYVKRGGFDYDRIEAIRVDPEPERIVKTEALHVGRDPAHALDVVLLSDGYTADQMDLFRQDADRVVSRLFEDRPFADYADRINVTRVDVPSNASGASYDCPTCGPVDTTFGSIFPIEVVNRVTGWGYDARAILQADQWRVARVLDGLPWDFVIVIVNSAKSGGMAVHYATVTRGASNLGTTGVHELGHAFGMLGDEYVSDDCIRSPSLGLPENIADDPDALPWSHHVAEDTPLPTPEGEGYGTGAYEGAWNCPDLYRPEETCRMGEGGSFCAVCTELLVRRLFRYADPADDVRIEGRMVRIEGAPPETTATVRVDGEVVATGPASALLPLPVGGEHVEVEVVHHPATVLADPTGDLRETWTFDRGAPGRQEK